MTVSLFVLLSGNRILYEQQISIEVRRNPGTPSDRALDFLQKFTKPQRPADNPERDRH